MGVARVGRVWEFECWGSSGGIVTQERLFCRTPMLNRISDYFAGASSERQAQKKTSEDVFLCIWWSRGDLNPRPPVRHYQFYMLSHLY